MKTARLWQAWLSRRCLQWHGSAAAVFLGLRPTAYGKAAEAAWTAGSAELGWGGALPMQWLTSLAWRGGSCPKPQKQDGGLAES